MNGSSAPNTDRTPSERTVERVAAADERDALALPSLYDAVDSEALDALVESLDSGAVRFTYAGHVISITSDGEVSLDD